MAQEDYVPVVGDDWYERRRDDEEGRFFRSVADQGPKKGIGGATRQGIYCFTAGGKLLAYSNNIDPEKMRNTIKKGLTEWKRLPEFERRPGALAIDDSPASDARYSRRPPTDALILNVYARILDHDTKGQVCAGSCQTLGGDRSSRDHMWLTQADWKSLIPDDPVSGATIPLPDRIANRLARFHLVDNTRGEPAFWQRQDVRSRHLDLVIESVSESAVRMRLQGSVLLATDADVSQADRGFDVQVLGYLRFDRRRQAFDRIDIVAYGNHWGESAFTKGAREAKMPVGVFFELAKNDTPANQVPPQGAREISEYLGSANR